MPLPTTDEALIISGITGTGGRTLTDLYDRLTDIFVVLQQSNLIVAASILVQEFFSSEDLDQGKGSGESPEDFPPPNTSIYGKTGGFQIDESDEDFPILLQAVHQHPDFQSPIIVLTWEQFLES